MAKKETVKVDVYKVKDKEGNVVDTLHYPEGGSLYEEAKKARESGGSSQVYKTNKEGDEIYTPTYEAKATTRIDPMTKTITVTGPSWLTSEIVNSDSFKKNYSENPSLQQLANIFAQNTEAAVPLNDGSTKSVRELLADFEASADSYSNSFAAIKNFKDTQKTRYGVDMSDTDVAIASSFYDKADYKGNEAVYLPKWAIDNYKWDDLESWDPKRATVSASDFFKKVYTEGFTDKTGENLRNEAFDELKKAIDNNTYDEGDEELVAKKKEELGSEDYATEVARTIHLNNLLNNNRPEVSAAYNVALFSASTVKSAISAMQDFGLNMSQVILSIPEYVSNLTGVSKAGGTAALTVDTAVNFPIAMATIASLIQGEAIIALQNGEDLKGLVSGIYNEIEAKGITQTTKEHQAKWKALKEECDARMERVSGAWAAGEAVGYVAWKIAENILVLNPAGELTGRTVSNAISSKPVLTMFGKILTPDKAASFLNGIGTVAGFGANVVAQGILETVGDEKELLDKALESGHLTDELWDALVRNTVWNAVGELGGVLGQKGGKFLIENTTGGRAFSILVTKGVSKVAAKKHAALARFFGALHGVKGAIGGSKGEFSKNLAEAIHAAGKNSARGVELYNIGTELGRSELSRTLSEIPLFRAMKGEELALRDESLGWVYGGKEWFEATTEEGKKAAIEKGINAAMEGAEKAAGESAEKSLIETKQVTGLGKRVKENYDNMRKQISLRANLENQIDRIATGARIKLDEINDYARDELNSALSDYKSVAELEVAAVKSGAKIERWEAGALLSKQSSEYLSIKVQKGRADAMLGMVKEGDWKNALYPGGKRVFSSATAYENAQTFSEHAAAKMNMLRGVLGEELVRSLDGLQVSAGRYLQKVNDYMMANHYLPSEQINLLKNLRKNIGWGQNGELYLPTIRLRTPEEIAQGFSAKDAFPDGAAAPVRRVEADMVKRLTLEDLESGYGDPIAQMFMMTKSYATVAQAQDLGRALHAVSAPLRAAKGYDMNGISKYEASIMERTVTETKADFEAAFKGSNYAQSIITAFNTNDVLAEGLNTLKRSGKSAKEAAASAAERKARGKMNELLFRTGGGKSVGYQSKAISSMDDANLNSLIANLPEKMVAPEFNPQNITAAQFDEWFESLPATRTGNCKQYIDNYITNGLKRNITNVRKIAKQNKDFITGLKREFVSANRPKLENVQAYKDAVANTYRQGLVKKVNITLKKSIDAYDNAMKELAEIQAKATGVKPDFDSWGTFGPDFVAKVDELTEETIRELGEKAMNSSDVSDMVSKFVERLGNEEGARDKALRYLVLRQISDMGADELVAPLLSTKGVKASVSEAVAANAKTGAFSAYKKMTKTIGEGLSTNFTNELDAITAELVGKGCDDLMDMEKYFGDIQKQMNEIESKYLFKEGEKIGNRVNEAQRRKIVQLIGRDGQMRFYETDPLYAALANEPIGRYREELHGLAKAGQNFVRRMNSIFRWGTTGIDNTSFVNQWMRDPINASIVGSYRPFIDLNAGGLGSKAASAYYDIGAPFGEKVFGKLATQNLTDEVVNATWEANRRGLIDQYGQKFFDDLCESFTKGATGDEAQALIKRGVAEYVIGDTGYARVPGLGGTTRAEFFRPTGKDAAMEKATVYSLTKERAALIFGDVDASGKASADAIRRGMSKFEEFVTEQLFPSKGGFREEFARKGVFVSQYRTAIESGMTMQEAKVWAERYALDATTNFNRTFMWGNKLIKSVPYLSAAINGQKSFWRLLEMDPMGVGTRLVYGLCLPYARMLSLSLSSEENREAYKNVKEYEKEDNLVFVWKGQVISIPAPQELSSFLGPFRHLIEKSAGVNDYSWIELAASDVLGLFPLDLSGFVGLDENRLMAQSGSTGIGTRITRGVEKAASGLMGPIGKSIYMLKFGRDPYTGQDIDTSYVVDFNDDGEAIVMDSSQSWIANKVHELFPSLSAVAAEKVLKSLLGRSTITVIDQAKDVLSGDFGIEKFANQLAEQVSKPFEAGKYDRARSEWNKAIQAAYERKEALETSDEMKKALSQLRNSSLSEEKRENARRAYANLMDEYSSFVLGIAKNMKDNYPEDYSRVRVAQIISLLTPSTGAAYEPTDYSTQLQSETYNSARAQAIDTLLRMGFPEATAGNNMLGSGYYKNGEFQFKVYTPFEIEALNNAYYRMDDQIQASITAAIKRADIDKGKMWSGYYAASTKADRKAYKDQWNAQVVQALYPTVAQYSIETVLNNAKTRELLDDYIFVDNPYQTKQYLMKIFGGGE